jgi:hypothetical protein
MYLTSSGELAAGSAAIASCRNFVGVAISDLTGDAIVTVWRGGDASGTELAIVRATDENQSTPFMLPGDWSIPTPEGIYYTIAGTSASAIIYFTT